ncbi:vWA domain-containing protein [Breznakiellaceae bacterium SP9]
MNGFSRFINFGAIADKAAREQTAQALYKSLHDSSNAFDLSNADTDNFAAALKRIVHGNKTLRTLCKGNPYLCEQITQAILDFINKTKRSLNKENPFGKERLYLRNFATIDKDSFLDAWLIILPALNTAYSRKLLDTDFHYRQFQNSLTQQTDDDRLSFECIIKQFIKKWSTLLSQKQNAWELSFIDEQRKAFCDELYPQIEALKKLQLILEPFTRDLGILCDMSTEGWQKIDRDIFEHAAQLLEKDKSLQELGQMVERMHKAEQELEEERSSGSVLTNEWKIEHAQQAPVIGITESDDVSSMLPFEALLLSNSATELLFYQKFAQKRLQTFRSETEEYTRHTAKEDKKGPIFICVAASQELNETPETIVKAACFALRKRALREGRKCELISCSTDIETLDLSVMPLSPAHLIAFLLKRFAGTASAMPVLQHALTLLETEAYKKADVLVLTDSVMPAFDTQAQTRLDAAKEQQTKFHTLHIGTLTNPPIPHGFAHTWIYDIHDKNTVRQLVRDLNELS